MWALLKRQNWGLVSIAILLLGVVFFSFQAAYRGLEIRGLEKEKESLAGSLATLERENARLRVSVRAVSEAVSAQSLVCRLEKNRLDRIQKLTREEPAAPVLVEAVNEKTSRETVLFINDDLFSPVGVGLRGEKAAAGSGRAALPGAGRAGLSAAGP